MAHRRHLRNAPIREAIIDIRVMPPVEFSSITDLGKKLRDRFPTAEDMIQKTFGFEVGLREFKTSSIDQGPSGIRLTSQDSKHIVQLKRGGFTFSRLHPYETWEAMSAEARDLWGVYHEGARQGRVTRAAVRYINMMPLPMPIADFRDFLTAPPDIPPKLPQGISSFFSRIVLPDNAIGAVAIVTQALDTIVEGKAPVILDIDVFKEFDVAADDPVIWETLEQLREYKNRIFFESITERTAELFE